MTHFQEKMDSSTSYIKYIYILNSFMLQKESYIDVADNSGAKFVKCIGMLKGAKKIVPV